MFLPQGRVEGTRPKRIPVQLLFQPDPIFLTLLCTFSFSFFFFRGYRQRPSRRAGALLTILPSGSVFYRADHKFCGPLFLCLEVIFIQLRYVQSDYLDFLRHFEPKVPTKSRPWLWPLYLDGHYYGIPLTTQDGAAGYPGYLRSGWDRGLNIRYMVPLPEEALLRSGSLPEELRRELMYYESMRSYITAEAEVLHRLTGMEKTAFWRNHCCDFQELESVYLDWTPGFLPGRFYLEEDKNMPVSKNGKLYYTKEQYEKARYCANALDYARKQGYELVRQSAGYYCLKDHDSMIFTPTGHWFWNSRGLSGGAMEFIMYYEGRTVTEAVLTLAEELDRSPVYQCGQTEATPTPRRPEPTFVLPEQDSTCKRLFWYLCSKRGLDKTVVQEMIRQGIVYQGIRKLDNGKSLVNACFVYRDEQGKAIGAYQRGISDPLPGMAPFKRDVTGSSKRCGWLLQAPRAPATEVRVFEGAIDAASDATLYALPEMGQGDWMQQPVDRLSLEGVDPTPLETYLTNHPNVKTVRLMLDADRPGREAAQRIADSLQGRGLTVEIDHPTAGKDWNETLTMYRANQQQTAQAKPEYQQEP